MEDIKLLVQEEGRSARNLVAFNVPLTETQCDTSVNKIMRKPPTSPRSQLENKNDPLKYSKRSRESSQSGSRVRSASTGRDKKSELHARYWAFLFGNLQRAVDEIYQTCESDESVTECKEVIMVLDNYTREFKNLINWFKIKWDYETTPPPQRPHSLAWEIRKSSPGKIRQKFIEPVSNNSVRDFKNINNSSFDGKLISDKSGEEESNSEQKDQQLLTALQPSQQISTSVVQLQQTNADETKSLPIKTNSGVKNECKEDSLDNVECKILKINFQKDVSAGKTEASTPSQVKEELLIKNCGSELNKSLQMLPTEALMTDEFCQTDPEKDVDEHGPKYRSSSQQTCPDLTGFYINDDNSNTSLDSTNEKKQGVNFGTTNIQNTSKSSIKSKSPENIVSAENGKVSSKSVSVIGTNKILLPANSSNMTTNKTTIRSSYSHAATNVARTVNSQAVAKPGTLVRLPYSSNVNRGSSSIIQRQPWTARSVHGKPVASAGNSPGMARLTRSKTVTEVSRSPLTARSKATSCLKQSHLHKLTSSNSTPCVGVTLGKLMNDSHSKNISVNSLKSQDNKGAKQAASDVSKTTFKKSNVSNIRKSTGDTTSSSVLYQETSGSVEVLTSRSNGNEEDDGWVKVRSKSRFSTATKTGDLETTLSQSASNLKFKIDQKEMAKMTHKTRFSQPSSAISLPTLAFSASECKENISSKKLAKTKSEAKNKLKENVKVVKKPEKNKTEEFNGNKKKNNGEKARKNCNRLFNEKNLNETVQKIFYTQIERAENKKNLNLGSKLLNQTPRTIAIDQESIDEDENNFDEEIKKNKEREEMLQKEISELEAADIELETGDEETDGEATTGTEEEADQEKKSISSPIMQDENNSSPKKLPRYQQILSGMSWADHMDTLDELEKLVVQDCSKKGMTRDEQLDTLERLEEFVARHPGRALELHQKLSSPSRRRTMLDTVKKFQARQAKALEKREQLKMEKAQRLRELLKKVDEVKAAKDKLIEDRRQRLEMKLKRAAENRNLHLKEIMRKAHDEEEKLKEIAFINELEAQNKRHDFMTQCQEQEGRLQGIHEERQRKQEEKAAKEAAVEERRKAIEAERQEKIEKMQERQRKRDEQADKKKQEKEKERQELAREKARDRSERLEALHAAQLEAQEELQKKIQQKQEDYARRHEENIEQIRQKALELSISKCSDDVAPRLVPYETQKLCTACNVLIGSEVYLLSHLRGKKHQEAVKTQVNGKDLNKEEIERHNIKIIVNAPSDKIDPKIELDKERIKNFKKKCKKIRMRMISKGEEYLSRAGEAGKLDSPGKGKLQKCLRDLEKVISSQGKGQWSDSAITTLERSMGELNRTLSKNDPRDQLVFKSLNGFSTLNSILQLEMDVPQNMAPFLPQKCFVTANSTYLAAVSNSPSNCKFVILSNKIISLLDILLKRLTAIIPDHVSGVVMFNSKSSLPTDPVASVGMRVIAKILMGWEENNSKANSSSSDDFLQRLQDIISYTVSVGIVDKLTRYCKSIRDPIDNDLSAAQFLLSTVELLTTLTVRCKTVRQGNEDPTQLLATLQVTELVGAVSILYGMLLHQGAPPRLIDAIPPPLPSHTIDVAGGTMRLLRSVAELDLKMFQSILGAEGISLQFRHIASYLLWYCCHDREKSLLHEVVAVVGYFAVQHRDNQMILQSGSTPTVLQQLCNLPFPYFSNPELSAILFPTLLACCSDNEENKEILEQEISYSLLEDFVESGVAANHPLIILISTRLKGSTE